mgnify:CR=1 FL=1
MTDQRTTDFSTLPPIMAVDFDGTLVTDKFPNIGEERRQFCSVIRKLQKLGIKSILWTSRTGSALREAIEWCEEHDLHFDAINENLPEVIELVGGIDTRKVYADVYFDDRNRNVDVRFIRDRLEEIWSWLGK